ncbi:hypothetical protein niasHT_009027 [Heterodera trifolii]|uniref:Uncharacterized protein n=1 Tax=Heterodera trifolii TaxID=157864 RepID=A0ABD2LT93_9BILA
MTFLAHFIVSLLLIVPPFFPNVFGEDCCTKCYNSMTGCLQNCIIEHKGDPACRKTCKPKVYKCAAKCGPHCPLNWTTTTPKSG